MKLPKHTAYALALPVIILLSFRFFPNPGLSASILIRLIATGAALAISIRFKEWKLLFLVGMFLLIELNQILMLLIEMNVVPDTPLTQTLSVVPGFIATILSLISILYIGIILAKKESVIQKQNQDLDALRNLLPICSRCKKIRDTQGYWNQIETYLSEHTDLLLTHSICESCAQTLYGDEDWFPKTKKLRPNSSALLQKKSIPAIAEPITRNTG
ncbi:MAG: hypothetical protein JXR23_03665 [Pontiellaceae bacterium]|nr:hypothetical protein [Pontiellaceae bacterium]